MSNIICVDLATTVNLLVSKNDITLTSVNNVKLTIDNFDVQLNDIVLVKNQINTVDNGLYKVINQGSISTKYVLLRVGLDDSQYALKKLSQIFVKKGLKNKRLLFIVLSSQLSVGYDSLQLDIINHKNMNYNDNPTINDDKSKFYSIGSRWFNTLTFNEFICTDATVGAAIWIIISDNVALNDHINSDGSDHSFINQNVTTTSSPEFVSISLGNIDINGNNITSTNINGNINLLPNGIGEVLLKSDPTSSLAAATKHYVDVTTNILSTLRHDQLNELTDDDHPQYALLGGRNSGQHLIGGSDANDNLTLSSTSSNNKGKIILKDMAIINDQGFATTYVLSIQRNSAYTYLEILNNGGPGKGAFFGIENNNFTLYNWQGGDIVFLTDTVASSGNARFTIQSNGDIKVHNLSVGIVKSNINGILSSEIEKTAYNKNFGTIADSVTEGTHVITTSDIHGVSGNIVGTSDSQTLTNKTIDSVSNTITLSASTITSGILPITQGGLGTSSLLSDGILREDSGSIRSIKNNWNATTNPTNSNDTSENYEVGSRWFNISADKEYVCLDGSSFAAVWLETTVNNIAGEINTASNIGIVGVGIFNQKNGIDLEFKKLKAASNKVTVADDTEVAIDIAESNINIQNLLGAPLSAIVGTTDTQILTNKTLTDGVTFIQNNTDNTKKIKFQLSGISTATTRIISVPDGNITLTGVNHAQTLTNKTINTTNNTITLAANDIISGTFANTRISQSSVLQYESMFTLANLIGSPTGDVVGTSDIQILSNKTLTADNILFQDLADNTKKIQFDLSSISSATTRTISFLDTDFTLVGLDITQTLTNKTIDTLNNTINIDTSDIISGTLSITQGGTGVTSFISGGWLQGNGTNGIITIKNNMNAVANPLTTDDTSSGYSVGSRWFNIASKKEFVCLESTNNSAVWKETTECLIAGGWTNTNNMIYPSSLTDKVGIGTNSPSEMFEIESGSVGDTDHIKLIVSNLINVDDYDFNIDTTSIGSILITSEHGTHRQALVFASDNSGSDVVFGISKSTDSGNNWSSSFSVTQNGLIGINKNNPLTALDVVGNMSITGTINNRDISTDGTNLDTHIVATSAHGIGGEFVGTTDIQTLTNKTINSSNNSITLSASVVTSGTFTDARIAESNVTQHETAINHDNLTGYVSNKHIDHSSISITGGTGLSGGGTIMTNRTLNLAINSLTEESSLDIDNDYLLVYDGSSSSHKKVLINKLPAGTFGSNYSYIESEGESTTTATSYITKVSLVTPTLPVGNYRIDYSSEVNVTSSGIIEVQVTVGATPIAEYSHQNSNSWPSLGGFKQMNLSGVQTITISYRLQSVGQTAKIRKTRLSIYRII